MPGLNSLWRGSSSIVRPFGRSKVFTAAAVLTVALGIGLNSVVFSLFDRLLFRPLPFSEPDRLVQIHSRQDRAGNREMNWNVLHELARQPTLFSGIAFADTTDLEPVVTSAGESPTLWFKSVTTNTLDVLGLRPVIGPAGGFCPPRSRCVAPSGARSCGGSSCNRISEIEKCGTNWSV